MTMMYDILNEDLIRTTARDGAVERRSLPNVYEALATDEVIGFPALRAHQRHAWHAFLAQLGTMAVHRAGLQAGPTDAGTWRSILRELTPHHPENEPWHLIVAAPEKPAFLQTPPGNLVEEYTKTVETPDSIDILVSSKNHDIKQNIARTAEIDDWIFALVTVQTTSGFLGRGRYGAVRMNSGFGSRPALGLTPDGANAGHRIFHDIGQMLIHRDRNRRRGNPERREADGHALMWLEPLDRNTQHELKDLDPYFIEAAQRIRLMTARGRITADLASRQSTSISAKASQGNLGDHWTPIVKPDGKALSVPQNGWRSRVLMRVIGDDTEVELPTAMTIKGCENVKRWRLVARGTAKKQGGTQGYHERCDITFDREVVQMLRTEAGRQRIHQAGRALDKSIAKITGRLRLALAIAAASGKSGNDLQNQHWTAAKRETAEFEAGIDRDFFPILESMVLGPDNKTSTTFTDSVAASINELAEKVLETGIDRLAPSGWRRERARAQAIRTYRAKAKPQAGDGGNTNDAGAPPAEPAERSARPKPEQTAANTVDPLDDPSRELQHSIHQLSKNTQNRLDRIPLDAGAETTRRLDADPTITQLMEDHGKAMPAGSRLAWAALIQSVIAGTRPRTRTERKGIAGRPFGTALQLAEVPEQRFHQLLRSFGVHRLVETVRACRRMKAMKTPPARTRDLCRFILAGDRENDAQIADTFYESA